MRKTPSLNHAQAQRHADAGCCGFWRRRTTGGTRCTWQESPRTGTCSSITTPFTQVMSAPRSFPGPAAARSAMSAGRGAANARVLCTKAYSARESNTVALRCAASCPPGLPVLARVLARGPMRRLLQNSFCACDDRTVLIVTFLVISHVSALLAVPVMFALSLKVSVARMGADAEGFLRAVRENGARALSGG